MNPWSLKWATSATVGLAIVTFATAWSAANPRGAEFKVTAPVEPPAILAVRFHHDMCPYCKKLAPQFADLPNKLQDKSVLLVTLDLTSEATQRQAALMVAALGIKDVWPGDLSKTGTVDLVDWRTREVRSSYRAVGAGSLSAALDEAVKAARIRNP